MNDKERELKNYLRDCATLFEENNRDYDAKVTFAFHQFPKNTDYNEVLFKVAVLNVFWGAGLRKLPTMADHIVERKIDRRLDTGDLKLVDLIAEGHRINGGTRFYAFAAKYCHWSRPKLFPVYDSIASWSLLQVIHGLDLRHNKGRRLVAWDLKTYSHLKENMDLLIHALGLGESWKYKRIDEGLYYLGMALGKSTPANQAWVRRKAGKPPSWLI